MLDLSRLRDETVFVTGGAGFIGCALARQLVPHVRRYVVLDNLHPQVHPTRVRPAALHEGAEFIEGDVTDAEAYEKALTGLAPDVVVHLAAETGTGQSLTEATRHGSVNVVGTTLLTDTLARLGMRPKHLVLSSSRAVYGEGEWRRADGTSLYPGSRSHHQLDRNEWDFAGASSLPSRATATHPNPVSVYAATKLTQEHVLRAWSGAFDIPLSVLRFQNVYGPGQSLTNSYTGIVALFSRLAHEGKSIPLYEDGLVTRDFVYIDDVAAAVVAAIARPPETSRTCDVGSGRAATIHELASVIAGLYGAPEPHLCGKYRDGDVRHASCDIVPTTEQIPWRSEWSLERGLASLKTWIDGQL